MSEGSLENLLKDHFPEELYCFLRWVIKGPNTTLSVEEKCNEIHKRAMSLVQSTTHIGVTGSGGKKNKDTKQS